MNPSQCTLELLADLNAAGVRLARRGVHLAVDVPAGTLTSGRLDVIRRHKAKLMEVIDLSGPCDGCGSAQFNDTPVHAGMSVRRDCAACGRTWGFPVWQGGSSGHGENYALFASMRQFNKSRGQHANTKRRNATSINS